MDKRAAGVYPRWERMSVFFPFRALIVEKVYGDGSVITSRFNEDDVAVLKEFLEEEA